MLYRVLQYDFQLGNWLLNNLLTGTVLLECQLSDAEVDNMNSRIREAGQSNASVYYSVRGTIHNSCFLYRLYEAASGLQFTLFVP